MTRFVTRTLIVGVALFGVIQVVRPEKTNPPVDPAQTLQAQFGESHPAVSVVGRACKDCHTNETSWPWYSHVAPVSWLVTHDVEEGREAVNFSSWSSYSEEQKTKLMKKLCEEVSEGEMPMSTYTFLHPDAKLSATDVRAICALGQVARLE